MDEVLTTEETAELIKLSSQTLLSLARAGELPAINLGNRWLFVKDQIMDYMRDRAKAEQIKRQEVLASQAHITRAEPAKKKKAGRPRKTTIDLSKYLVDRL